MGKEASKPILSAILVNIEGHLVDIGLPRASKELNIDHFNSEKSSIEVDGKIVTFHKKEVIGMDYGGFVLDK